MSGSLPPSDLEGVWEAMALAIDRAGPERDRLFLAKLAILLANALGDGVEVERLFNAALEDVE